MCEVDSLCHLSFEDVDVNLKSHLDESIYIHFSV